MKQIITNQQRQPVRTGKSAVKKITFFAVLGAFLGMGSGTVQSQTTTLVFTGAAQAYTVPAGVTNLQLEAWGAAGGIGNYSCCQPAGNGGYAKGSLTVTPGEVLMIYVGGQGASTSAAPALGGFNGGGNGYNYGNTSWIVAGGGGASDVRRNGTALSNRVIVAGGGGGGGGSGSWGNGAGGDGGGLIGVDGHYSGFPNNDGPMDTPDIQRHGKGGTQSAGGAAGSYSGSYGSYNGATSGSLGLGGNADNGINTLASGGGGGYYGGGGGSFHGGGGGGGSSYVGTLTNTLTSSGGQTGNGKIVITILFSAPVAQSNVSCNGGSNGSATVAPNAAPGPYTYTWSPGGSNASSITGLAAGVYTVSATSSNSLTTTQTFTITQPAVITSTVISQTNVTCNGGSNGSASVSITGGTAPYTYTWSPSGGSAASATGLIAGTYTISVNDANSCGVVSKTLAITQPSTFAISGSASNPTICNGGSTTLSGSGATTYTWTGGVSNGVSFSPTTTTSYSLTATNATGCSAANTVVVTVTVNAVPTISVTSGAICSGNSFTMVGSGANTYTYTGGSAVVSPTANSSYSVTGTSSAGCVGSNTAVSTVTVNALPVISVNSATVCAGTSVVITPTGASTYSITGGTFTVTPASTTSYSVTGTSTAGCLSASAAVSSVSVNAVPVLTISGTSVICNGGSSTFTVTGASTYSWNGASIPSTIQVSPSVTTVYTVSGTSNNCSSTVNKTVTVNVSPTISVNNATICSGTSVVITPTGGATYTITSGNFTVSPVTTTSYSITGSSAAGCPASNTAVASVSVNATPTLAIAGTNTICNGSSATFTLSGATTYSWNGTASTSTMLVSPTTTTVYTVSGASNGCTGTVGNTVTVNALPVLTITGAGSICVGSTATLSASGATTYTWSTASNASSVTVSPVVTTTYAVSGTNTNNCVSALVTRTLIVNTLPTITVNSGTICSGQSFTLTGAGAGTYTYSGGSVVSPTSTSSYSVTGTSTAGCASASAAVGSVTVNALPVLTIASPSAICIGNSASLSVSGASTYTWSTASNGSSIVVSPATTTNYAVSGTDANSCVGFAGANITVNALPVVTISGNNISCSGAAVPLAAHGASTYVWSTSATTASISVSPATSATYSVVGTDLNGCVSSGTFGLHVNALPTVSITGVSAVCQGGGTFLSATGADSFTWNSGATTNVISVTPTLTTAYSVNGVDANGCNNTGTFTLTVNPLPVLSVVYSNSIICVGESATVTVSGADALTWIGGLTGSVVVITPFSTTSYTVTGTNTTGCASSAVVTQSVSDCTGIKTINGPAANLSVYPNPNSGEFTISTSKDITLNVINEVGQTVKTVVLNNSNDHKAGISNLPNGIYFVTGQINSQVIKQKIIVAK